MVSPRTSRGETRARRRADIVLAVGAAMLVGCGRVELEPYRPGNDAGVDRSATNDAGTDASPADGGHDAETGGDGDSDGARDGGGDADAAVICTMAAGCPNDACEIRCCPDGPECAPCCFPRSCQAFTAAACPRDGCQVMVRCDGTSACLPKFNVGPPPCGGPSNYRQDVDCCAGLSKRCGVVLSNNTCDLAHGGYDDLPWCLPCGDGNCDQFEDRCSCPEDCS
jgi:hypothetical protein